LNQRASTIGTVTLLFFVSACSSPPPPGPATPAAGLSASAAEPKRAAPEPSETEVAPLDGDEGDRKGYLRDIFFVQDRATLSSNQLDRLSLDAEWLKKFPAVRVRIEGHCDERGTAQYNLALGEQRAEAVRGYLQTLGIDPSRVEILSFGKERPFALGHDEASWAQNRRCHFVVISR
jgi:peptidoglycan-associated lipoprotein